MIACFGYSKVVTGKEELKAAQIEAARVARPSFWPWRSWERVAALTSDRESPASRLTSKGLFATSAPRRSRPLGLGVSGIWG